MITGSAFERAFVPCGSMYFLCSKASIASGRNDSRRWGRHGFLCAALSPMLMHTFVRKVSLCVNLPIPRHSGHLLYPSQSLSLSLSLPLSLSLSLSLSSLIHLSISYPAMLEFDGPSSKQRGLVLGKTCGNQVERAAAEVGAAVSPFRKQTQTLVSLGHAMHSVGDC